MNKRNIIIIIILTTIIFIFIEENNQNSIENFTPEVEKASLNLKTDSLKKIGNIMFKKQIKQKKRQHNFEQLNKVPEGFTNQDCGSNNFISYGSTNPNILNAQMCNLNNNLKNSNKSMLK